MNIRIENLTKQFANFRALDHVNLEIPTGNLVSLLGPSGCGKTTLLRIIAGLEEPDKGAVYFDGEDFTSQSIRKRGVGFVFQHYALFRHMTVAENIAFGLKAKPRKLRPSKSAIDLKVQELLDLVELSWVAKRFPSELSGGQRQRIALARALAVEPKILLLDEPFGALDANVRKDLRKWLRRLHDTMHITSVFVTHDQEEALEVSDKVVVINKGKIEQIGTPEQVYNTPASPFVYHFLGNVNLFHGRVDKGEANMSGVSVKTEFHQAEDSPAIGYVRPYDIQVKREKTDNTQIFSTVHRIMQFGALARLELKRHDNEQFIEVELSADELRQLQLRVGDEAYFGTKNMKVFLDDYSI